MSKKNSKKVNLRKLQANEYSSLKDWYSINKEHGDGSAFSGTFEEIEEIDTQYGLTLSYKFTNEQGQTCSLLTKSKVFERFFKENVQKGDFVTLSKDVSDNLWYLDEVESA